MAKSKKAKSGNKSKRQTNGSAGGAPKVDGGSVNAAENATEAPKDAVSDGLDSVRSLEAKVEPSGDISYAEAVKQPPEEHESTNLEEGSPSSESNKNAPTIDNSGAAGHEGSRVSEDGSNVAEDVRPGGLFSSGSVISKEMTRGENKIAPFMASDGGDERGRTRIRKVVPQDEQHKPESSRDAFIRLMKADESEARGSTDEKSQDTKKNLPLFGTSKQTNWSVPQDEIDDGEEIEDPFSLINEENRKKHRADDADSSDEEPVLAPLRLATIPSEEDGKKDHVLDASQPPRKRRITLSVPSGEEARSALGERRGRSPSPMRFTNNPVPRVEITQEHVQSKDFAVQGGLNTNSTASSWTPTGMPGGWVNTPSTGSVATARLSPHRGALVQIDEAKLKQMESNYLDITVKLMLLPAVAALDRSRQATEKGSADPDVALKVAKAAYSYATEHGADDALVGRCAYWIGIAKFSKGTDVDKKEALKAFREAKRAGDKCGEFQRAKGWIDYITYWSDVDATPSTDGLETGKKPSWVRASIGSAVSAITSILTRSRPTSSDSKAPVSSESRPTTSSGPLLEINTPPLKPGLFRAIEHERQIRYQLPPTSVPPSATRLEFTKPPPSVSITGTASPRRPPGNNIKRQSTNPFDRLKRMPSFGSAGSNSRPNTADSNNPFGFNWSEMSTDEPEEKERSESIQLSPGSTDSSRPTTADSNEPPTSNDTFTTNGSDNRPGSADSKEDFTGPEAYRSCVQNRLSCTADAGEVFTGRHVPYRSSMPSRLSRTTHRPRSPEPSPENSARYSSDADYPVGLAELKTLDLSLGRPPPKTSRVNPADRQDTQGNFEHQKTGLKYNSERPFGIIPQQLSPEEYETGSKEPPNRFPRPRRRDFIAAANETSQEDEPSPGGEEPPKKIVYRVINPDPPSSNESSTRGESAKPQDPPKKVYRIMNPDPPSSTESSTNTNAPRPQLHRSPTSPTSPTSPYDEDSSPRHHRRKTSLRERLGSTLGLTISTDRDTSSPKSLEAMAEEGESPMFKPKNFEELTLSVRKPKSSPTKSLEELAEEGESPVFKPRGFGERGARTP